MGDEVFESRVCLWKEGSANEVTGKGSKRESRGYLLAVKLLGMYNYWKEGFSRRK